MATSLYAGFLYLCLLGLKKSRLETLMYAMMIFSLQFGASWLFPGIRGYPGWLLFAFLIGRFVGVAHPPCEIEEPLSTERKLLGWLAIIVFVISFAPAPLELIDFTPAAP